MRITRSRAIIVTGLVAGSLTLAACSTPAPEPTEGAGDLTIGSVDLAEAQPAAAAADDPAGGDVGYQLTHDYLVPSLRQWMTRKQRETHRGRAELRMAAIQAL